MTLRDTCPQRTVVKTYPSTGTWLPVVLSCGHNDRVNATLIAGDTLGCIECQRNAEELASRGQPIVTCERLAGLTVTRRQFHTILAALRSYQCDMGMNRVPPAILDIASNVNQVEPLDEDEIETLCLALNMRP